MRALILFCGLAMTLLVSSAIGALGCGQRQPSVVVDAGFVGVVGVVSDEHFDLELVGATVSISDGRRPVAETRTNAEGHFELELLPGAYLLQARYAYQPSGAPPCSVTTSQPIEITSGQSLATNLAVDSSSCFPR